MSFKSSFGALEDTWGSWLGFGILILTRINVLEVLIWGFGGPWRFLIGAWHLDLDLNMVTGFWHTNDPNFGFLSWFWRCKEHPCPLSHHLGLPRTLDVPDWGLASRSWFGYGHKSLIHPWSKFWLSILTLKVQRTSMSFKSSFGVLEDAGGSWSGVGILILTWTLSLVFDTPMIRIWLSVLISKVQRTSMSFRSSFGALEDAGGSWLGFGILILFWIWSMVFDAPMIRILALYLDFEGAKNIHVL